MKLDSRAVRYPAQPKVLRCGWCQHHKAVARYSPFEVVGFLGRLTRSLPFLASKNSTWNDACQPCLLLRVLIFRVRLHCCSCEVRPVRTASPKLARLLREYFPLGVGPGSVPKRLACLVELGLGVELGVLAGMLRSRNVSYCSGNSYLNVQGGCRLTGSMLARSPMRCLCRKVTPREGTIKTLCLFLRTPLVGASALSAPLERDLYTAAMVDLWNQVS